MKTLCNGAILEERTLGCRGINWEWQTGDVKLQLWQYNDRLSLGILGNRHRDTQPVVLCRNDRMRERERGSRAVCYCVWMERLFTFWHTDLHQNNWLAAARWLRPLAMFLLHSHMFSQLRWWESWYRFQFSIFCSGRHFAPGSSAVTADGETNQMLLVTEKGVKFFGKLGCQEEIAWK